MKKLLTILLSLVVVYAAMISTARPAYTDMFAINVHAEDLATGSMKGINQEEAAETVSKEKPAKPIPTTSPVPTETIHQHDYLEYTTNPTCVEKGKIQYICECGDTLAPADIPALGHQYEAHITEPSCTEPGFTTYICNTCKEQFVDNYVQAKGHQYGEWQLTTQATPDTQGSQCRTCLQCKNVETQVITFQFKGPCAIYIPSANIHAEFTITTFSQASVDAYDVVYSWVKLIDGPFILGHKYRSMHTLYDTEVGDIVYVNLNGTLIRYQVVVSEYGVQKEGHSTIIGQTTGTTIWDKYEAETLHMYTCYGPIENDRWIVLAVRLP